MEAAKTRCGSKKTQPRKKNRNGMNGKEEGDKGKKKKGSLVKTKKYKGSDRLMPLSCFRQEREGKNRRGKRKERQACPSSVGKLLLNLFSGRHLRPCPTKLAKSQSREGRRPRERETRFCQVLEGERRKVRVTPSVSKALDLSNKKAMPEIWTLWLAIGSFDPVTFEVDSSLTIHEMKKLLTEEEEFELQGFLARLGLTFRFKASQVQVLHRI